MNRSTGWKPDLAEHVAQVPAMEPAERVARYGASRLPRATSKRMMQVCSVRDQFESSACVGFTIAGAAYARLRYLGYEPELFSPLVPYNGARQMEGIYKGKELPDDGSHPFLAFAFVKKHGLAHESVLPWEWLTYYDRVREELDVVEFQKASQFRISNFSRIDETGDDRVDVVMQALASGHVVPLGMQVGREFNRYTKSRGPVGIEVGADLGGHMTFLVDYEDDGEVFIGCNSWSRDYGDNGFYRIHKSKLVHESTTDLYDFIVTDQRA